MHIYAQRSDKAFTKFRELYERFYEYCMSSPYRFFTDKCAALFRVLLGLLRSIKIQHARAVHLYFRNAISFHDINKIARQQTYAFILFQTACAIAKTLPSHYNPKLYSMEIDRWLDEAKRNVKER